MNLIVALGAVTIIGRLQDWIAIDISHAQPKMVTWRHPVTRVASQAQKGRRLVKQVIGYRAMWLVTDGAILRHWCVFVSKGPLFFCVTFVANHVQRRLLEIPLSLPMRIMAIRASNFSFFDRMM